MSTPPFTMDRSGIVATPDEQLERVIGPWGLGANAVNSAIGGGIFVLPGLVAAMLGPAAIAAYLVCGIAVGLVLTCFAEIGSTVQRSGGTVAYVEEAFGPFAGFLAWVVYAVGFDVVSCAAIGNLLVDALAFLLPSLSHGLPRVAAFAVLFGILAVINVAGVKQGMRLSAVTTISKLLPLVMFIFAGLFVIRWHELEWAAWPPAAKLGEGSLLIFFAFQGAEEALSPSAEIRDVRRTVPRAMLGCIATLIVLYVALQAVSQGVLGRDLGRFTGAPLAEAAARIAGPTGRALMLTGVALSIFGSLSAGMIAIPRSFFLMAQNGMLPAALARVHPRFRTPHIAIITVAVTAFLLSISGAFRHLAILSSVSILFVYLAICLGALRLRYTRECTPGAFRAPGGPVVGVLGAVAVVWLLTYSTRIEFAMVGATILLGTAYYVAHRLWLRRRTA